jgi:hypothetical protein
MLFTQALIHMGEVAKKLETAGVVITRLSMSTTTGGPRQSMPEPGDGCAVAEFEVTAPTWGRALQALGQCVIDERHNGRLLTAWCESEGVSLKTYRSPQSGWSAPPHTPDQAVA